MDETYKKELTPLKWLFRLTERLTIITTSLNIKTDLGLTEDDIRLIRTLHGVKELQDIFMYETVIIKKDDDNISVTQPDLFDDDVSVTAKVDTLGIDIDTKATETTKDKKK